MRHNNALRHTREFSLRARVGVLAFGAVALAACGSEADGEYRFGATGSDGTAPVTTEANPSTTSVESSTTTTIAEQSIGYFDGSDEQISNEAAMGVFNCGAEKNPGEWDVNFMLNQITEEENEDLLEAKYNLFVRKTGSEEVLEALLSGYATNEDAEEKYQNHENSYVRFVAAGRPVQMTDEAVQQFGSRENYMCNDIDGSGIGDEVELRDYRSNVSEGMNVTLLGTSVTVDAWNKAVEIAKENGKDLTEEVIHQYRTITVVDKEGESREVEVVDIMIEDDSCGNPVYVAEPPEMPPIVIEPPVETTPPTVPPVVTEPPVETTPPTVPPVDSTIPDKPPTGTTPQGGGGSGGNGENGDDPGNDSDDDGYGPGDRELVDTDNDGIHNEIDRCPNQAETWNGYQDDDGCPDVVPATPTTVGQQPTPTTGAAPTSTNPPVPASTSVPAGTSEDPTTGTVAPLPGFGN